MSRNRWISQTALAALFLLALTACNMPASAPVATETPTAAPLAAEPEATSAAATPATEAPTVAPTAAPEAAEATPAAAGACLVGKWQLADFTSYFASIQAQAGSSSGGDVTIKNDGVSGNAWFTFNNDGTAGITAESFTQSFTVSASVADSAIDVPASVTIHGASQANYRVEGDQIAFSDQQIDGLTISVTVMGNTTNELSDLMGDPGTVTPLYQYSCADANTLSLKVLTADVNLAPLTLTRVP